MIRLSEVLKEVKSTNDAYIKALSDLAQYLKTHTVTVDTLPIYTNGAIFYQLKGSMFSVQIDWKDVGSTVTVDHLGIKYQIENQQLANWLVQQVVHKI